MPAPQQSDVPESPSSRWRWENRWLVLPITVIVSTSGYLFCLWEPVIRITEYLLGELDLALGILGVDLGGWNFKAVWLMALLWFHPFALQLGPLRSAAWVALVGIGSGIYPLLYILGRTDIIDSRAFLALDGLVAALAGIAMVGRRTRPWMAVLAGASFPAFAYAVSDPLSYGIGRVILHGSIMFSYSAILIFGTKLIPKRSAPAPPDN